VGILGAIEDTERVAQRILAEPRGVLKITCGVEFGMIAVNRWINGFMKDHPQVSVDADYTSRVIDIVHEGFDLAIRLGDLPDSRLTARKLGELEYGLFASKEYLKRRGIPKTAADLEQHNLLIFSSGSHRGGWTLTENGISHRVNHSARLIVNNSFAVCDAARSGLGIAQLPLVVANDAVEKNELTPILQKVNLPTVPVHAVFPSSRYLTPKVRAFIDYSILNFD
jgi:DNA-binding transcriptional LysR family regulator